MISEAELRRRAADMGIDPLILDLDYALGWFLAGIYRDRRMADHLRFKGGTCLAKAYFAGYRFSEDLDFTAAGSWSQHRVEETAELVARWSEEVGGPNFRAAQPLLETISDDYGSETFELRVYFRGPLVWSGSPRAVRLHITRDERLVLPAENRALLHPYSDAGLLGAPVLHCYCLAEMLAEKLRALSGQRRFPIARDIYDVHRLASVEADPQILGKVLKEKLAAKGMTSGVVSRAELLHREAEFRRDWQRNLAYLLPRDQAVSFTAAWSTVLDIMDAVGIALRDAG